MLRDIKINIQYLKISPSPFQIFVVFDLKTSDCGPRLEDPDLRCFRLEDPCSFSPLEDPDIRRSPLTCSFAVVGEGDETMVVAEDVMAVDTPVEVVDCKA
ncbi:hypothetical protein L1987_83319 [Smallanthus sonchifolius]|uniref:Uncharacterized protein n=1 Tax=Smallanthus sonchifolius TaxID=185202 RepID=A0ACB8YB60_9ASTR|nr:hypothetical protein L1987_83319 [Smallanthus sonchifolius]